VVGDAAANDIQKLRGCLKTGKTAAALVFRPIARCRPSTERGSRPAALPSSSPIRSAGQAISAREDGKRIDNRRCYRRAELQLLNHASVRRRGSQVGQRQDPKRRCGGRHNGSSHWEHGVKRQHGFDPQRFNLLLVYAGAPVAAVTGRIARAPVSWYVGPPEDWATLSARQESGPGFAVNLPGQRGGHQGPS
jgi:hypothetical protein